MEEVTSRIHIVTYGNVGEYATILYASEMLEQFLASDGRVSNFESIPKLLSGTVERVGDGSLLIGVHDENLCKNHHCIV